MTFIKGQSGNPAGRPPGSRNKSLLAMEQMIDGEAAAIVERLVRLAKLGDPLALRLCIDRIVPRRREWPVPFGLPRIHAAADVRDAHAAIAGGIETGELTPSEAARLACMVATMAGGLQAATMGDRLAWLEEAVRRLESTMNNRGGSSARDQAQTGVRQPA